MTSSELSEIRVLCPDAEERDEGGLGYLYLPKLSIPKGTNSEALDGLLCLGARDGYPTRLFLSAAVSGKGSNWTSHAILGRTWWACSWTGVLPNQRPMQILAAHLDALR